MLKLRLAFVLMLAIGLVIPALGGHAKAQNDPVVITMWHIATNPTRFIAFYPRPSNSSTQPTAMLKSRPKQSRTMLSKLSFRLLSPPVNSQTSS